MRFFQENRIIANRYKVEVKYYLDGVIQKSKDSGGYVRVTRGIREPKKFVDAGINISTIFEENRIIANRYKIEVKYYFDGIIQKSNDTERLRLSYTRNSGT